jgi:hypothetical protein
VETTAKGKGTAPSDCAGKNLLVTLMSSFCSADGSYWGPVATVRPSGLLTFTVRHPHGVAEQPRATNPTTSRTGWCDCCQKFPTRPRLSIRTFGVRHTTHERHAVSPLGSTCLALSLCKTVHVLLPSSQDKDLELEHTSSAPEEGARVRMSVRGIGSLSPVAEGCTVDVPFTRRVFRA